VPSVPSVKPSPVPSSLQWHCVCLSRPATRLPKIFQAFKARWNTYSSSPYAYYFFGKPAKKFLALAVLVVRVQRLLERIQSLRLRLQLFW
jgi:hypothetical protein